MAWRKGDILVCIAPTCTVSVELHSSDWVWIARSHGWGITDDLVLCPTHSGRQREPRTRQRPILEGEQPLFTLPAEAVVPKRKKRKPTS